MEQHREEVDMIRELDNDFVKDLAEFFKIFGDATRIRILRLLMDRRVLVAACLQQMEE